MSTTTIDSSMIQQWINAKAAPSVIEKEMTEQGMDKELVDRYLAEFRRLKNADRQMNGFIFLGLGAVLGFISCLLSITNPFPDLYNIILFGLTSVSISIICLGLYFLFE